MFDPNEVDYQKARIQEMIRIAEVSQFAAEKTKSTGPGVKPFYAPAVQRIGEALVDVGTELQRRYGTLLEEAQHITVDNPASPTQSSTHV